MNIFKALLGIFMLTVLWAPLLMGPRLFMDLRIVSWYLVLGCCVVVTWSYGAAKPLVSRENGRVRIGRSVALLLGAAFHGLMLATLFRAY